MARTPEKKPLEYYEKQKAKRNEAQKLYRQKNKALCELWQQRSYCNYLRAHGWTVTPPPGFPTLEEFHAKKNFIEHNTIDTPPIDLSDVDELLKGITKDDLPFE